MHHPTDRITHTTAFITPVVEHWLEREIKRRRNNNNKYINKNEKARKKKKKLAEKERRKQRKKEKTKANKKQLVTFRFQLFKVIGKCECSFLSCMIPDFVHFPED